MMRIRAQCAREGFESALNLLAECREEGLKKST